MQHNTDNFKEKRPCLQHRILDFCPVTSKYDLYVFAVVGPVAVTVHDQVTPLNLFYIENCEL